jgi:hypothetical protein
LLVGDSTRLAFGRNGNVAQGAVTWESRDTAVAVVQAAGEFGIVRARRPGSATIILSLAGSPAIADAAVIAVR